MDNTFDSDGKVTTSIGIAGRANSIAIQSDGKIIVAGKSTDFFSDFTLVRYNSDGSLDNTFDSDGIVITSIGSNNSEAYSVIIQPDGKIIVVGQCFNDTTGNDFGLARYNSDGSLDNTFDSDGKVTTDLGGSFIEAAHSVSIQTDGKIVVAGCSSHNGLDFDFGLARYNSDGSLDNTFDSDGKVTIDFGSINEGANSIAIQSDGKILAAGWSFPNIVIVRYNSDGSLDNSFDNDGIVTTLIGVSSGANALAIQSDGKILVAGSSGTLPNIDFALARYNSDGSLDITFDSDGMLTTDFAGPGLEDVGLGAILQPDGKIVVAGYSGGYVYNNDIGEYVFIHDFAVARYINIIGNAGIEEADSEDRIMIYPNPNSGIFNLQINSSSIVQIKKLEVYNVFGEKVFQSTNDKIINSAINLTSQPKGIYFVSIISGEKIITKKIIIE